MGEDVVFFDVAFNKLDGKVCFGFTIWLNGSFVVACSLDDPKVFSSKESEVIAILWALIKTHIFNRKIINILHFHGKTLSQRGKKRIFNFGEKPRPFMLETRPSFISTCLSVLSKKEKIDSKYWDHLVEDKQHERPYFPCKTSRKQVVLDKYMLSEHALNIIHYFPLSNYKPILHWCAENESL